MIEIMEKVEASIPIFSAARKKYDDCKFRVEFAGQGCCNLFKYMMDTSTDLLHHCGSCKFNTKEPSTMKDGVRNS